jgi:hypothetical protein
VAGAEICWIGERPALKQPLADTLITMPPMIQANGRRVEILTERWSLVADWKLVLMFVPFFKRDLSGLVPGST